MRKLECSRIHPSVSTDFYSLLIFPLPSFLYNKVNNIFDHEVVCIKFQS